MKLDGFGIMVDDMGVMVRFYRDVLGFGITEDVKPPMFFLKRTAHFFCFIERPISKSLPAVNFPIAKESTGIMRLL